jgi:hypothetical protein
MRKSFRATTLLHLRETPSDVALRSLAIYCKVDASFHPIKDIKSHRWHVRTEYGEFGILTTGLKWYDPRAKIGGGGAIDLAMHILQVPFVEAVRMLSARIEPHG